jgi:rhodanese-related sulfurtransferase
MDQSTLIFLGVFAALIVGFSIIKRLGQVSVEEAHRLVKEGAKLVDVRTPDEFSSAHLSGAINLPLGDLGRRGSSLGPKDKPIVLYCASGARSSAARSMLKGQGFTQVFNLGAMSRWS